ncbi:MAG: DNA primase [Thermovirgaceae bacterium]|nr:DNA primase [Synergistales bacterium]
MNRDAVRTIKDRIDIVELIGESVQLRRAGKSFRGLCPFHAEKTPSFFVSSERQTYHCFGCGRGGDLFSFVMEKEGMTFPEALALLADRAGVALERPGGRRGRSRGAVGAMEKALAFFRRSLAGPQGESARKYLERRGIGVADAAAFELGWAPPSWDSLKRELEASGVPTGDAMAAGLLAGEGTRVYDRFRGRVIFPIRDLQGRLVAFGGRLVDGEGAKYINSPEGELYSKRRTLYLLNAAKPSIREKGRSILVEGYMDAIKLHMAGFPETVASLGTALAEEQADLLKRFADQCLICYDSDAAGQEATIRGMYTLQKSGLDIRVVVLPTGKDPDDVVSAPGGREDFLGLIKGSEPLPLFHIRVKGEELSDERRKTAARREIIESLAGLPPLEANRHITQVAQGLGLLLPEMVDLLREARRSLGRVGKKGIPGPESVYMYEDRGVPGGGRPSDPWEAAFCYLLWTDETKRAEVEPARALELLSEEGAKFVALSILSEDSTEELRSRWAEAGDDYPMRLISTGWGHCAKNGEREDMWDIVLSALETMRSKDRFDALREKHARGEASPEEMREYLELARKLKRRDR